MLSNKKNTIQVLIAVITAVVAVLAVAVYFAPAAVGKQNPAGLVSPAEQRARDAFRASWKALTAQSRASDTAAQVPVTGDARAMSEAVAGSSITEADREQRVNNAYSQRLNGLASEQLSMLNRAQQAYSARLEGLANQQTAFERANNAYSARLEGLASYQTAVDRANSAYSARLSGLASQQLGMSQRALGADAARWQAAAKYYQSQPGK